MSFMKELLRGTAFDEGRFDTPKGEHFLFKVYGDREDSLRPFSPSEEYRIVKYELRSYNQLHLEAMVSGEWVSVEIYDTGYYEGSKIYPAKWKPLGDDCSWSEGGIKRLKLRLEGSPEIPVVVN